MGIARNVDIGRGEIDEEWSAGMLLYKRDGLREKRIHHGLVFESRLLPAIHKPYAADSQCPKLKNYCPVMS